MPSERQSQILTQNASPIENSTQLIKFLLNNKRNLTKQWPLFASQGTPFISLSKDYKNYCQEELNSKVSQNQKQKKNDNYSGSYNSLNYNFMKLYSRSHGVSKEEEMQFSHILCMDVDKSLFLNSRFITCRTREKDAFSREKLKWSDNSKEPCIGRGIHVSHSLLQSKDCLYKSGHGGHCGTGPCAAMLL